MAQTFALLTKSIRSKRTTRSSFKKLVFYFNLIRDRDGDTYSSLTLSRHQNIVHLISDVKTVTTRKE